MSKSPARVQAIVAVVLALALGGAWVLFGTPWRVRWIVARGSPPAPPSASAIAVRDLRAIGADARPVLESMLLEGTASRERRSWVAGMLLREPFFARGVVEKALGSPHPPTARAAAAALLGADGSDAGLGGEDGGASKASAHGWDPAPAIPILVAWVADRGDDEASLAARLLGSIPPGDPRVRDALLAVVEEAPDMVAPNAPASAKARKPVVVAALLGLIPSCATDVEVPTRVSKVVARLATMEGATLDWDLQAYSVDLLEAARGRGVDESLLETLAKHEAPVVRQKLANALAQFPGSAPSRILAGLAGDEWPIVRRAAVRGLGARKDPMLLDLAPYLLEDSLIWVRSETLLMLGHLTGVAPERCREAVPLIVGCFETPWPGMVAEPGSPAAVGWAGAVAEIIENCALTLNRITGRCHGFRPEDLLDWKRRAEVAEKLAKDPELRAKAVAEWRTSIPPWPDSKRIPPLVKRLEDRDPDNILRAMRELHRITGQDTGFPAGVLDRSGDDTEARNAIRVWRKTPARDECLRKWKERAADPK